MSARPPPPRLPLSAAARPTPPPPAALPLPQPTARRDLLLSIQKDVQVRLVGRSGMA